MTDDIFARALAAAKREQNRTAIVYPRNYAPRKCAQCGDQHAPFGVNREWFCRAHRPAAQLDAEPKAHAPQSRGAAHMPFPERAQGKLIIENMVSGVRTEIDLGVRDNVVRFERGGNHARRERKRIEPRLPPDPEDMRAEFERLQIEADERNTIAEAGRLTSRFCRCGRLSDLGFEIDGALVWRCFECRGETLED